MRQRIVINLEGSRAEGVKPGRKRRRWTRVLGILAVVVLIGVVGVAAGGFLLVRHYQSTPTYALSLMLDAAQRNNVAEFQKRIDGEEIAKNIAVSVSQKAAARYGYALNGSIQQQIDSATSSPRVKQAVQDEFLKTMQTFAAAPEQRSFTTIYGAVPKLITVATVGDSAKATGTMGAHVVEMTMRRDADGWKVVDVKDDLIVQRIVDGLMNELPAIGNIDANSPLLKKPQRKRSGRGR